MSDHCEEAIRLAETITNEPYHSPCTTETAQGPKTCRDIADMLDAVIGKLVRQAQEDDETILELKRRVGELED